MPFSIYGCGLLFIRFMGLNYVYVAMLVAAIRFTCSVDVSALMIYLSNFKDWIKFCTYQYFRRKLYFKDLRNYIFYFFNGENDIAVLKKREKKIHLKPKPLFLKDLV